MIEAYSTRAPTSRPLALVESGQRLTHQLRLVDDSTRPTAPAPTDPAALALLTMTTKSSFRAADGGKAAA